jgi:hypothetical protein
MGTPLPAREVPPPRTDLRLYVHPEADSQVVFWRINGFRARLLIWTVEEWEKLEPRPTDAQYHPSGVWCALRLD